MRAPRIKPTVVIPDAAPLIHLAAADALDVLTGMGRVVIPDIVAMEATYVTDKPYASQVAAWIAAGQIPGSNQPVEIAATEIGTLYRLALEQNLPRPRNAGEIGIAAWLADTLADIGGPALAIYENGRLPGLLSREGVAAQVAVATTRNLLSMAQENGLIEDAATYVHRTDRRRMTSRLKPIIQRYADGEISAMQAATLLGEPASVADVIVMLRQAGLHPPLPPEAQLRAELDQARRVLGMEDEERSGHRGDHLGRV